MYKLKKILLLFTVFSSIIAMENKEEGEKNNKRKASTNLEGEKPGKQQKISNSSAAENQAVIPKIETEVVVGSNSNGSFKRYKTTNPSTKQYIETEIIDPLQANKEGFKINFSEKFANIDPELRILIGSQMMHQQRLHQAFIDDFEQRMRNAGKKTDIDVLFKSVCGTSVTTNLTL
jgi:hypothetical protein